MPTTLALDVYGTLIDTQGVLTDLRNLIGDKAEQVSRTWRDKQLEYAFRRGLMQTYEPFNVCTLQALNYACAFHGVSIDQADRDRLMATYRSLPAFNDVRDGLTELKANNCRLFAFSNGTANAVDNLLTEAGIRSLFDGIVSVDEVKSFKPDPAVYRHFLASTDAVADRTWLVSSNPFDVIGARSAGWQAAWVQRSKEAIYDPWDIEPSAVVSSLSELIDHIH